MRTQLKACGQTFALIIVRCPFREEHLAVCRKFFLYTCHFGEDVPSCHVMSPPLWGLLVAIGAGLRQIVCSNGPPMYKSIWHLGQVAPSAHVTSLPPPLRGLLVAVGAGLGQMVCSNGPPMYNSIWDLGQDVP